MRPFQSRNSILILLMLVSMFVSFSCRKPPVAPPAAAATPAPPPPPPPPPAAPTVTLTANPPTINAGQSSTLTWQTTNATSLTIDPELGTVATNGNRQVSPTSSVTYMATVRGPGGNASVPARVTVNPAPAPPAVTPPPTRPPVATLDQQFDTAIKSQPILFDYDKSDIRPDQIPKLQNHATWLKMNASVRLSIQGHADERGSQEYNIALGDERAVAVKKYLASQGVADARMVTVSYGEERPACTVENEDCFQRNRRASFEMLK